MANEVLEQRNGTASVHFPAVVGNMTITTGADLGSADVVVGYADLVADIQTAFEGVTAIGSGNILVAEILNGSSQRIGLRFSFRAALANTAITPFTVVSALFQDASTISVVDTTPGVASNPGTGVTPSINQTAPGVDASNPQTLSLTFSADPTSGSYDLTINGSTQTFQWNDTISGTMTTWIKSVIPFAAFACGAFGSTGGGITITLDDGTGSNFSFSVGNASTLAFGASAGTVQISVVTEADSPARGELDLLFGGVSGFGFYIPYNADAAFMSSHFTGPATGWGASGSAGGPWTLTAPSAAANVAITGANDVSDPLAKSLDAVIVEVTPGGDVPTAPSSPTATATSTTAILVGWADNSSTETGFKVQQSADGTTGWTTIHTTSAGETSYSVTGLATATKYYFRVCATNSFGDSSFTSVVNATTNSNTVASLSPFVMPPAKTHSMKFASSFLQIGH